MKINIPANTKIVILNIVSNEMIELNKAVNEAKTKLGLSNSELSKLIGHSRNYLSEALRVVVSTDKQKEIQTKIEKAVEVELVNRGVTKPKYSIDVSYDQSVMSEWVSKAYHDQEVNILKHGLKCAEEAFAKKHQEIIEVEKLSDARWDELQEQKQNVRMLNMEVEQLKQKHKDSSDDLAIANRNKNFMKRKLNKKNEIINYACPFILLLWFIVVIKWWV